MKNKIILKRFLLVLSIIVCLLISMFLTINVYEYNTYNKNFNKKISSIMDKIESKYPDIEENEILEILNNESDNEEFFRKYNFDINKDTLIKNNEKSFYKFLVLNVVFYALTIGLLLYSFLKFNNKKDKEINKITKCIEEINRKNYRLELDDMSEDELSILKNEIYKTTITLKEAAENSNKEKLDLKDSLSDISHQLKTPLTSILIALDNIIDDPDMDKEVREDFIRDIKREITNINFLVQSILKLSKLDTNTVKFIIEDVYLKDIIDETKKNLSMLCDLKSVDLKVIVEDNPIIKCDFKWQTEAISNIVKNCIEHSEKKSTVTIKVSSNKVYEQIIIEDRGNGIGKEDLPHIFERFYKGKNSTPDSIGIGLSLSKTIIEKDNGTISVESDNNGTRFIIKYFK